MRKYTFILALALFAGCEYVEIPGKDEKDYTRDESGSIVLTLADPDATAETKALYSNLWAIREQGYMFGHHDDLIYGRYWYGEEGRSDTKEVCGDYPAVLSVDFAEIIDDRFLSNSTDKALKLKAVKDAYDRGMLSIVCLHLDNPLTGGDAWDNSSKQVVQQILTEGSTTRATYMVWMDRLAETLSALKGSDGKTIPIVLRPYHEHTQGWSWWGSSCTTEQEFKDLWQWTVKYLRDTKGIHNVIYAIAPQMDSQKTDDDFLYRWPGDEWVDFIGMDCYQGINNAVFTSNLKAISRVSTAKKKPCGVTETGVEGFTKATYWTENIHAPMTGRKVSLLVTWRNKYVGSNESDTHYFSVYPGHPSEADFVKMYRQSNTIFCGDLPDMYSMAEGVTVK